MELVRKLWNDDSGASAAEYALLLALVSVMIVGAINGLRGAIIGALDRSAAAINSGS